MQIPAYPLTGEVPPVNPDEVGVGPYAGDGTNPDKSKEKGLQNDCAYEIPNKGREVTPPAYRNHGGPQLEPITPGTDAQTPGSINGEPSGGMGWGYLGDAVQSSAASAVDASYSQFLKSAFPIIEYLKSMGATRTTAKDALAKKYAFLYEHRPWLKSVQNVFLDKVFGQEVVKTAAVSIEELKYGAPEEDITRPATKDLFVSGSIISCLEPAVIGKVISVSQDYTYAKIAWALGSASVAATALSNIVVLSSVASAPYKKYFSTSPALLRLAEKTLLQPEGNSSAPVEVIETKPGVKLPPKIKKADGTTLENKGEAQQ